MSTTAVFRTCLPVFAVTLAAACGGGASGGDLNAGAGQNRAPTIESVPPTSSTADTEWSYELSVGGTPRPSVTVTGLPEWMSFDGDRILRGTPGEEHAGPGVALVVRAMNGIGDDAVQQFAVEVRAPARVAAEPATAYIGEAYATALTVSGYPAPTVTVEAVPAWLGFDGTAALAGTPTSDDYGDWSATLRASNGVGEDDVRTWNARVEARTTVLTPYIDGPLWTRTLADDLNAPDMSDFDAGNINWKSLGLPTPPDNAIGAILVLRGSATGASVNGTDSYRTKVRLQVRRPGDAAPDHRALRITSTSDTSGVGWPTHQQNTVLVPLGESGGVEVAWEIERGFGALEAATIEVHLQGWVTGGVDLFTPFSDAGGLELFHREIGPGSDLPTDGGSWISVPVLHLPEGAHAVLLNLHGRADGGGSAAEMELRSPGAISPISSAIHLEATNSGSVRDRNLVAVPLGPDGNIEVRYELASNSSNDEASVSVHLQGVLFNSWDVKGPGSGAWRILHRDTGDLLGGDHDVWSSLVLPDVPTGAKAVLLSLAGRARGYFGGSTRAQLSVRSAGDGDPIRAALLTEAVSDDNDYRSKTLVLLPLDESGTIEYRYLLEPSGSSKDEAQVTAYVQGFVIEK